MNCGKLEACLGVYAQLRAWEWDFVSWTTVLIATNGTPARAPALAQAGKRAARRGRVSASVVARALVDLNCSGRFGQWPVEWRRGSLESGQSSRACGSAVDVDLVCVLSSTVERCVRADPDRPDRVFCFVVFLLPPLLPHSASAAILHLLLRWSVPRALPASRGIVARCTLRTGNRSGTGLAVGHDCASERHLASSSMPPEKSPQPPGLMPHYPALLYHRKMVSGGWTLTPMGLVQF